ncbi:Uncharacterized protein PECH_007353 [Penicillium ucsense]|uniref:Uncharacterized protein n=1 Tax=Penicillium ucsense TaxID=2839758 RepID=A0A8J8W8L9_9EURO|nr:Uncharacterized protein PECM_003834 [Penicillium ucsense]KAF7734901.1 Uncharacterized protein PECH_007353 [Penicillium ucsense]
MLPLLHLDDGDTLAFIDPEPRGRVQQQPAAIHRIRSQTLLATESTYLRKLFSTRKQSFFRRQRGFSNHLPKGITYVIDLTPQDTEEEETFILTEVVCPMQIRTWRLLAGPLDLPSECVGGEDENETVLLSMSDLPSAIDSDSSKTSVEIPVEYSAKRHRECIEMVIRALEGFDVTLDTASRMWTYSAIVQLYQIGNTSLVTDPILAWFYHAKNIAFLDYYPQVAYRLACGIKQPSLCKDAFVLLVGDEALLYMMRTANVKFPVSWSLSSNPSLIADFNDDEVQRIEYASKSFAEKVMGDFVSLAGEEMRWLTHTAEFAKLTRLQQEHPEQKWAIESLMTTLKRFVRYSFYVALCDTKDPCRSPRKFPAARDWRSWDEFERDSFESPISDELEPSAVIHRLLSRRFWGYLMSATPQSIARLYDNQEHNSIAEVGEGFAAFREEYNAMITQVRRVVLDRRIRQLEQVITTQEITSASSATIPSEEGVGFFNLNAFISEALDYIRDFAGGVLYPRGSCDVDLRSTEIVSNLSDDQFRLLPLWAGGNDDGTGGVFADPNMPFLQCGGFSAPGPSIHTRSVVPTSSRDSYSEVSPEDSRSTIQNASHRATESHKTDVISLNSDDTISGRARGAWSQEDVPFRPSSRYETTSVKHNSFGITSETECTAVMSSLALPGSRVSDGKVRGLDSKDDGGDEDFEMIDETSADGTT